ncbi:MAG: hypothetical protein U0Z44_11200 [Kouleothrix sp.]
MKTKARASGKIIEEQYDEILVNTPKAIMARRPGAWRKRLTIRNRLKAAAPARAISIFGGQKKICYVSRSPQQFPRLKRPHLRQSHLRRKHAAARKRTLNTQCYA